VTIAISTVISAINSLTLSPALSAVLLQPHGAPKDRFGRLIERSLGWLFRPFNRVFKRAGERYSQRVERAMGRSTRWLVLYGGLLIVTVFAFRAVPGGFIPTQDKQYLFAGVLLPEGASLDRTEAAMRKMAEIVKQTPGTDSSVQFPGLNAIHFVSTPNIGVVFIGLKPQHDRKESAAEIAAMLSGRFFGEIKEGLAFAFMPPPVLGLGNAAGLEIYVQDKAGLGYGELNNQTQALAGALRGTPGFDPASVLSTNQANVPQLSAKVDRQKVKEQGIVMTDLFDTLQVYLGSAYVNDINLFGRTYSVYAQADSQFRDDIGDISRLRTRNQAGQMVPIGSVLKVEQSYGPDPVIRYNGYPAADISAGTNPALMSSSEAIVTAARIARDQLPSGMSLEWTGLTYQQANQGNASLFVFPLCVLLVFLVLAALYESWSLPLAVILIVPLCMLSAIGGIWLMNFVHGLSLAISPPTYPPTFLDNNIFTQIGLVVLMGLACKNAILIVEFARDLEKAGRSISEAAIESCRLRLRPILMTSFAFIAGVVPLVFASGAGSEVRHVMGITVFCGMLGVTLFGLFLTPVFYVTIRTLTERRRAARDGGHSAAPKPEAGHV
jgi:hydrophobe/amphiphile efflux-1 (HAE1) family protein